MSRSHCITQTLLSCLSDAMKLDDDARFEKCNRDDKPSNTALKLVYEPTQANLADVVENKHTDGGTLTLLFGEQWGLQMEMPDTKEWAFVEPRARQAVINVADSLDLLSGKRLHSCLHRVTQPFGGFLKRYYIVYLLRPEIR
jgi:isopenicillin N synthase-like dioxygenase